MNLIKRVCSPYKLKEVFTPNTVAKLTYINRSLLETDLEKYISLPGKQIVVYGHSGSGKTTLIRTKLKELKQNFIRTHCESSTTFNDIILQAFDELNRFYISEKTLNREHSVTSELKAEYSLIKSNISSKISESEGFKNIRIVPPQLTPQKLAQFLGEINCVWLIEDFHKVEQNEKRRIADVIKVFIDSANDYEEVKVICIGAVGTARELIELDDNLNTRIAEMLVPLLNDDEISKIIDKGCDLLNIKMSKELKEKIKYYSNNLASLTHQICYDICYHNNVKKSQIFKQTLNDDSFKVAVDSYVRKNSDTFTKLYDSIVSETCGWHILKTFEHSEKEYLSLAEIEHGIPQAKKIGDIALLDFLERLGSSEYKELIRFDRISKKYSISTPFFRAFLKMKIALEKSENSERNHRRKNKRENIYSIENPETKLVLDDEFIKQYYQYLDSFIIRELKFKESMRKIDAEFESKKNRNSHKAS